MEPTSPSQRKISRRITVIRGSFQTRYVMMTATFAGLLALLIFLDYFWFIQDTALQKPARPDLPEVFQRISFLFYLRFALYFLALVAFLYVLLHRLAGPVVRFTRLAQDVSKGDLSQKIQLRKMDSLKELQGELNEMVGSLAETIKSDRHRLEKALAEISHLQSQPLSAETRNRLESMRSSLSQVLSSFKLP